MIRKLPILCIVLFSCLAFRSLKSYVPFPKPTFSIPNPKSKDSLKINLGRLLFFDPILSADSSLSCASCHTPQNAFAHTDHDLSHGIHDQIGKRNAPALFNLAWQRKFMWDGAINHIEMQALAPISNPEEMGEELNHVLRKLNASLFYRSYFFKTFGDSIANSTSLLRSLAAFELSLISTGAKYDEVNAGKERFSAQEQRGYNLFRKHCNRCHTEPLFSSYEFASNGLPPDTALRDIGVAGINHQEKDSLQFKVPSLRNLSYSYPYMHDGRFQNLYQVLKHYTNGVRNHKHATLHLEKPIPLTSREQTDLVSFLLTLNDSSFTNNPQHSFPKILLHKSEGNNECKRQK